MKKIDNLVKIQKDKLPFGAKILNVFSPALPLSFFAIVIKAGARFDPQGKEGMAHLLEHLMMGKTKEFASQEKRMQVIESAGIAYNAFTSNEAVYFYHQQSPEKLLASIDFLLDGFNQSIINQENLKKEKQIILDEEYRNRIDPSSYLWRLRQQGLWPKSNLGRGFYGNAKSLAAINLKALNNFRQKFYQPDQALFVALGNQPIEKIKKQITKHFKNLSLSPSRENLENFKSPTRLAVDNRKINRVSVGFSYVTCSVKNLKDRMILDLIRDYLANSYSSQLVKELRLRKNYTYWVEGESENLSDTGYLSFVFSVDKKNLNQSLEIIKKEILKLKKQKLSIVALRALKNNHQLNLLESLLVPRDLFYWYAKPFFEGSLTLSPQEYIAETQKVSAADILKVANKYLTYDRQSISLVGPVTEKAISLKL